MRCTKNVKNLLFQLLCADGFKKGNFSTTNKTEKKNFPHLAAVHDLHLSHQTMNKLFVRIGSKKFVEYV